MLFFAFFLWPCLSLRALSALSKKLYFIKVAKEANDLIKVIDQFIDTNTRRTMILVACI